MFALPPEQLDNSAVATHVHSVFRQNPTCSGKQTIAGVALLAKDAGYSGVAFNEHTTDPGSPKTPPSKESMESFMNALEAHSCEIRETELGIPLWTGVEANIMLNGQLDIPSDMLCPLADYIIASQHGGLGASEKDPEEIRNRLTAVCRDRYIHAIGHPTRYNDDVAGVSWPAIFEEARKSNTLVELNLNHWYSKGPGRGRAKINSDDWFFLQLDFWRNWTKMLFESGAPVVIGFDAHNEGMWPQERQIAGWETTFDHFAQFILLLKSVGFTPERIVNSSVGTFSDWVSTPKPERSHLVTW